METEMHPPQKVGREDRLAVSIADAAFLCGLGRNSIYRLLNEKTLPSVYIYGRRLIRLADLKRLFDIQA